MITYQTVSGSISGVRQGDTIASFLFDFVMVDVIDQALQGFTTASIVSFPGLKLTNLDYADDIVLLFKEIDFIQPSLDSLSCTIHAFELHFAPAKFMLLFPDFVGLATKFFL